MDTENKKVQVAPEEDYAKNFVPKVHKVGRLTIVLQIVLSLLPVAYIVLFRHQVAEPLMYFGVLVSMAPMFVAQWISEPLTYYPIIGAAGTYMGYFSGNVSTMRFPVAVTVQKELNADINTPRGQVATIVGIAASVVSALVFLVILILGGEWILSILPEAVLASFDFVTMAVIGAMVTMMIAGQFAKQSDGTRNIKGGALNILSYAGPGCVITLIINNFLPSLSSVTMLLCIGTALVIAYIRYRIDLKKAEDSQE